MKTIKNKFLVALTIIFALCSVLFATFLTNTNKNKAYAAVGMQTMGITCGYNDVLQFDVTPGSASDVHLHYCFIQNWSAYRNYFDVYLDGSGTNTTGSYVTDNGNGTYTVTTVNSMASNAGGATDSTVMNNCYFTTGSGATTNFTVSNYRVIAKNVSPAYHFKSGANRDLNPVFTNNNGFSFIYKMMSASTDQISFAFGNWGNYYGYYKLDGNGTFITEHDGLYLQDLGDGLIKVTLIKSDLTKKASASDVGAISLVFINNGTTGNGFYYDMHGFDNYNTITVNGTTNKAETGTTFSVSASAPASGQYFIGWSNGSTIVSTDMDYSFTVSADVNLTAQYGTYRGTLYSNNAGINVQPISGNACDTVEFDYKLLSGTLEISILNSGWGFIQNYFTLNENGLASAVSGVSTEKLSDGYVRVSVTNANMTSAYILYTNRSHGDVYVDNVAFYVAKHTISVTNGSGAGSYAEGSSVTVTADAPASGEYFLNWTDGSSQVVSTNSAYTFTVTSAASLTANYGTYRGTRFTVGSNNSYYADSAIAYDTVSFDYILDSMDADHKVSLCLLDSAGSKYYGYYGFYGNGVLENSNPNNAISISAVGDGYYHVEFTIAGLGRTNNSNNTNNAPSNIARIFTHASWSNSSGYIDNVVFTRATRYYDVNVVGGTGGGTNIAENSSVTVVANTPSNIGEYFLNWTDENSNVVSTNSSYTFNVTKTTTLTANFGQATTYTVSVTGGTGAGVYVEDTNVSVTANAPASGKYFHHWKDGSDAIVSTSSTYNFTASADVSLTAVYYDYRGTQYSTATWISPASSELLFDSISFEYMLTDSNIEVCFMDSDWSKYFGYYTLSSSGLSGTGIACEQLSDGYFRVTFDTSLLNRTNNAWNRNNVPTSIYAIYSKTAKAWYVDNVVYTKNYTITVVNGTGSGTYSYTQNVTVTANSPASGQYFAGWSDGDNIVSNDTTYVFTPTADITLTATYGTYISITVNNGVTSNGIYNVVSGTSVTVTPNVPNGKYFLNWTNNSSSVVSTTASYTFTASESVILTANLRDYTGTLVTHNVTSHFTASSAKMYDQVAFEYKIANIVDNNQPKMAICLLDNLGQKYFGYYDFNSSGIATTAGITTSVLSDGYIRVVMTVAELARTGNSNNLDNAPSNIYEVYVRGNWTGVDAYIRNVTFKSDSSFKMVMGASIRTENPNGIKFTATIPEAEYDSEATYGMIVIPYDYLIDNNIKGNYVVSLQSKVDNGVISSFRNFTCTPVVLSNGDYQIKASLTNIKQANINRDFIGIAYKLKDDVYTYAELDDNRRSITTVAEEVVCDLSFFNDLSSTVKTYLEGIANAVAKEDIENGIYTLSTSASINQVIEFRYKKTTEGNIKFAIINSSNWSNYYGYYTIDNTNMSKDIGIQVSPIGDSWTYSASNNDSIGTEGQWYKVVIDIAELQVIVGDVSSFTHFDTLYFKPADQTADFEVMACKVRSKTVEDSAYYSKGNNSATTYDYTSFKTIRYSSLESFYYYVKQVSNVGGSTLKIYVKPFGEYVNINPTALTANKSYVSVEEVFDGSYTGWVKVTYDLTNKSISSDITGFYTRWSTGEFLIGGFGGEYTPANGEFKVNGFDSAENFTKADSIPDSATLSLSASKNENELGQLVITGLNSSVIGKHYSVTLNDLTHTDGSTKLSYSNFTLYNGHYINIYENWVVNDQQPSNWYPEGYDSPELGYYVDAIVPWNAAVYNGENIMNNVDSGSNYIGNNQTVYINFYIPAGQKAGTYSGTFRVLVDDNGYVDVPVVFVVYDFILPSANNAVTEFDISLDHLTSMYGTELSYNSAQYEAIYDYLLDFGISAGRIPETLYYLDHDWNDYVTMLQEYTENPNVSAINLYVTYDRVSYTYQVQTGTKFNFKTMSNEPVYTSYTYNSLNVINEYDRATELSATYAVQGKNYDKPGLRTILTMLIDYSITNDINMLEKLYIRLPQNDEPHDDETYIEAILSYNAVRRSIDYALTYIDSNYSSNPLYSAIRASLDNLSNPVSVSPKTQMYAGNKLVDNVYSQSASYVSDSNNSTQAITITYKYLKDYIPMYNNFISNTDSTAYNNLQTMLNDAESAHTHVWWYGCQQPTNPYPNYDVNSNHVISRSSRWAQFGMGVEGELYYGVNWWRQNIYDKENQEFIQEGDPANLTEAEVWQGLSGTAGAMGDGVLIYPSDNRYETYNNSVSSSEKVTLCATYRLFVLREGVDDYNYLCYAQQLIDAMSAGASKTNAQNRLNNIVSSMYESAYEINDEANILRIARTNLATLIAELA